MKKFYLLMVSSLMLSSVYSQGQGKPLTPIPNPGAQIMPVGLNVDPHGGGSGGFTHSCKSHEFTQEYYQEQGVLSDFNLDYQQSVALSNQDLNDNPNKTPGVNTISVIFHVVYNTPAENVSNALIMQVFQDLTEDFQLLNADASNARSGFGFIPADANINFCLATQTPAGVPLVEPGVVRVATAETFYDSDAGEENKMKSAVTGGSTIWNRNNYLNVWICDISNGAGSGTAGYAYMPSGGFLPSSLIDGIVLDYNLGMNNENVLTHEVGHYLGLDHTWGGSGGCTLDDGFTDTPQNNGPSFNYPGSCSGNQLTCPGIQTQYENYMDYANCTCMFTAQQANYMLSILTGIRSSLLLSPGCDPTNTPPVSAFTADIASPIIIPVNGTVNLIDQSTNVPTGWAWTISGTPGVNWTYAGGTNGTSQNPSVTFLTVGLYNVTLTASNGFGPDATPAIQTGYIQVVAPSAGTACDTLRNYNPATENVANYILKFSGWTDWGYLPGHGAYDPAPAGGAPTTITRYADRYISPSTSQVKRLIIPIYQADNLSGAGFVKIRVHNDGAGIPGTVAVVDTFLFADMDPGYFNEFDFTVPPNVTGAFWISFEFFYGSPQDTCAIGCVNFDDRALTTGLNTMKMQMGGTYYNPSALYDPAWITSLYMDVLLSNGPAPVADMDFTDFEVCPGGQIVVNGSGSTNTTHYNWYQTDDPYTTTIATSTAGGATFTFPGPAGDYAIYLFADGSCETSGLVLPVTVNPAVSAGATFTNTTCGYNNGSITVTGATGGDGTYTYSLDGVNYQASNIFSNLPSGNYTVYVLSGGDECDHSFPITIGSSIAFNAGVSLNQTICPGDNATITASLGTGYQWFNGGTSIATTASTIVSPTVTTTYNCVVTSGACQSNVMTTITVDPLADASFDFFDFCDGAPNSAVNIATPGGSFSFVPLPGDGATINSGTGEISNEVNGTTYTVQYLVTAGCDNSTTQTVTVNTQDDPQFTTSNYCSGTSHTVTGIATPGGTFTFNGMLPATINPSTGVISNGVAGTTYLITYTTPVGPCQAVSAPVSVTVGTTPSVTAVSSQTICQGANFTAINFTGTGGSTFNWTNTNSSIGVGTSGSGNIAAFGGTGTTPGGSANVGSFVVTPTLGACSGTTQNFTLTVNALPDVDAGVDQTVCTGTAVTLSGAGAASYAWDNGVVDGVSFTPTLGSITYTVTGTGANTCVNTDDVVVTVTAADDASFTTTNICEGGSNLVTNIIVPGGTFTYDGTDASTIDASTGIITGGIVGTTYNITYTTPLSACQSISAPVAVTVYANPVVSGVVTNDDGSTNGAIDVTVTGGASPYDVTWDHGPTTEDVTGLTASTYGVSVIDANGCFDYETFVVISTVGINDNPLTTMLSIYPNPTSGVFTIVLPGDFVMNVTDSRGRLVVQKSGVDNLVVDLDLFESGLYFVQVVQGENSIVKKIIKE